jgi:colanic acid biosynthesis glycosyl transferase WcaI
MNFAPEVTGIGKYSHEMALWLQKEASADIRVVCSVPYYPQWKIHPGHKNWYKVNIHDSIVLFRCPIFIPKRISGITRMIHLASYAISSSFPTLYQIKWKPDLIFCVAPNLLGAIIPLMVGKMLGVKTWLHIQDLEIDAAERLGIIKNKILLKILYKIENALYSSFTKVSTISEGMKDQLLSKGIGKDKVGIMPNWANLKEISPITKNHPTVIAYLDKLKLPQGTKIALYSGSISEKQGLEELVLAAQNLQLDEIVILICGNGPNLESLKILAASNSKIKFIDLVPKSELNLLLNIADVHLLVQKNEIDNQVMPSKLANMIAVGGPVIAIVNDSSSISDLVTKHNLGITLPISKIDSLADAIQSITNNQEKILEIANNCSTYSQDKLSIDQILKNNFLN